MQAPWAPKRKTGGILTLEIGHSNSSSNSNSTSSSSGVYWCSYDTGNIVEPFEVQRVQQLAVDHDLAVTGASLAAAAAKVHILIHYHHDKYCCVADYTTLFMLTSVCAIPFQLCCKHAALLIVSVQLRGQHA
jgi:hypothetical protein